MRAMKEKGVVFSNLYDWEKDPKMLKAKKFRDPKLTSVVREPRAAKQIMVTSVFGNKPVLKTAFWG